MAHNAPQPKVEKPYLIGSWCGRDAWKTVPKRFLAVLGISALYFAGALLISFDSLIGRLLPALLIIGLAVYYQTLKGMTQGTADVAYGEMMYSRRDEGKEIAKTDQDRCYHWFKGFFTALMGALPFVLAALYFALNAQPSYYALGALPSWTEGMMRQSEFGDALRYYGQTASIGLMDILRIGVRAAIMPVMSVATFISADAALLAERLSPLFVLIAPLAYGFGYLLGPAQRTKINTGIVEGVEKKRRKERKARRKRSQSKAPERLI